VAMLMKGAPEKGVGFAGHLQFYFAASRLKTSLRLLTGPA
jgi:hypothetical protein